MLDPRPSASAPSGQTASSDFLQEPTASRPVRKPGTYGFSRLTSVSRMRTSLSLTAFPSSTAVSPGWMPSLAAQDAGIRSLFLKPSSRLSTSGKAVGCKVRLRLVFPYCPLSPLRKCAPLALRHCGRRLAERNRSVFHSAPCNVGPGCSVQTLPCVSDCAKPARPAAAPPCLLAPEVDCMLRLEVKFLHLLPEFSGQIGPAVFPEPLVESEVCPLKPSVNNFKTVSYIVFVSSQLPVGESRGIRFIVLTKIQR